MSIPLLQEPELDLDYGGLGVDETDELLIEAPRYVRSEVAPYASPPGEMDAMWDTLRAFRARKLEKVDVGGRILETGLPALPMAAAPKRLIARLEGAGFTVRSATSCSRVEALRFAGSTDKHDAGDVRTPEHLRHYFNVQAYLERKGLRLAYLWATWERREVGPKPSNTFSDAITWDIVTARDPDGDGTGRGFETTAGGFEEWVSIFAPKGD